jgi:hypothetical protein
VARAARDLAEANAGPSSVMKLVAEPPARRGERPVCAEAEGRGGYHLVDVIERGLATWLVALGLVLLPISTAL